MRDPGSGHLLRLGHILTTRADAVVSSNPGCLLQIASRLEQAGQPIRPYHLVELLDASIKGEAIALPTNGLEPRQARQD